MVIVFTNWRSGIEHSITNVVIHVQVDLIYVEVAKDFRSC
jgi:hypothetical protein